MAKLPLFASQLFQQEFEDSYQEEVNPLGDLKHGPIEFIINGNDDFIDLSATTLYLTAKIVKSDGSIYDDTAEVGFINNVLHSLFADVIVAFNDTTIEGGEMNYSLKSMIGTLFSYSNDTMKNQLFAAGFVKDDAGKADDVTNSGYITRRNWSRGGASKEFYGKLSLDLFRQSKYLIGNVNIRLKFIKAAYAMALWTNDLAERPKFIIDSAKLYLKKLKPCVQILEHVDNHFLEGGLLYYSINRSEIIQIPIASGSLGISKDQLFYGRVPKLIIMAMCDNEALSGVYSKNPYNFQHYNVRHLDLRIDGMSKPILPLTPNFASKMCTREYMSLLESMSILGKDACLPFSYDDFLNGYTFFSWNLAADESFKPDPSRHANIRLDLKFGEATKTTISVLLFCMFDSNIILDGSGNIFSDFKD